ncbi:MAG: M3 family metallopeptidase [Rikenellaceae bacterium]|nr:M3 family metallopeptidase [Rikenellaceae bacterium]
MKRFFGLFFLLTLVLSMNSCKKGAEVADNPFFEDEWTTPYGVPPFDRIKMEHYAPAFERGMSLHNEQIEAIISSVDEPTFENTILAYDNSGQMLMRVATVFELLASAETNDQMQAYASEIFPRLAAHYDAIAMNEALFERVKQVYNSREAQRLTGDELRLTEKMYEDFVRSGALLSAQEKASLQQINEQLSALSVKFGQNVLAETNAFTLEVDLKDLDGLPTSVRDAAREQAKSMGKGDKYVFTLQKPSMLPLLTYAQNRSLREQIYKAYLKRGDNGNDYDNNQIVAQMAQLRYKKAQLLGYDSYAHYVTSNEMASTPEAVYELLEGVWTPALERSQQELERMMTIFRRDHGADAKFESWDWWYYAEKVRQADYDLKEEEVRNYFSLDNVKGGIFFLCNRLYGITFRPLNAPVYHSECEVYEVIDSDDQPLGALYMDFFPRPGKSGGAWCGSYVEQSYKDGKRVLPVSTIVCNFTRPAGSTPALLTIDETETFFHEFGHALHNLFAEVKYRGLAGVEGDFVELPSQIMENWALAPEMLARYAVHYRREDAMPQELVEKIQRTKTFNEGFNTTELVAAALSDMDIHSLQSDELISPSQFERDALTTRRGLIPQIEPRYKYTYFGHIFDGGYSAGYYFYIWAEVLDKDAYQAFVESGDIFDRATAERFRREVLARGGSRDGMDMYRAFRGADPDKQSMLIARGLVNAEDAVQTETEPEREVMRVDTREQARQRAERSRREREAARQTEADSLAAIQSAEPVL